MAVKRRKKKKNAGRLAPFVLFLLALVSMGGAVSGEFLFDDVALIQKNQTIHGFSHWQSWLSGGLWDTSYVPNQEAVTAKFWRPLVLASYALNWAFVGDSPPLFHITNLLLHAVNAILVYRVLRGWNDCQRAAFAGAMFFAVHPALTESVCWISGRPDVLCATGLLTTVLGLRRGRLKGHAWATLGILISFASKEAAVVLPILVTVEFATQRKSRLDGAEFKRLLRLTAPALIGSLGFVGLFFWWGGHQGTQGYGVDASNQWLLVLEAYGRYLELAAVPHDVTIGQSALTYEEGNVAPHYGYVVGGTLLWIAVAASVRQLTKNYSSLAWGTLAFVGLLLPVSGVRWMGYECLVWPRFLYIPLIAGALVFGSLAFRAVHPALERPRHALLLLVGLLLTAQSALRSRAFQSAAVFWSIEQTQNPNYLTGAEHFLVRELNAGRPNRAVALANAWLLQAERWGGRWRSRETLNQGLLDGLLAATPDAEQQTLREIERCSLAWAQGEECTLRLPDDASLSLGSHPEEKRQFRKASARYLLKAANAASRLGHDRIALDAIKKMQQECGECWTLLSEASLFAARIGRLDHAEALMNSAVKAAPPGALTPTQHRFNDVKALGQRYTVSRSPADAAAFYVALGAYGRAYDVASPALNEGRLSAGATNNLAFIALLSGRETVARAALKPHMTPTEIDNWVQERSTELLFLDKPTPPALFQPAP